MNSPSPIHFSYLLAFTALGLLSACGSSSISPEEFSQRYAAAQCERSGRCDSLAPYLVEHCKAEAADRIHAEDVKRAVDAGRLVYDEEQAELCIEGIQNTRCLAKDVDDSVVAACQAALKGKVPTGGACSFLYECAAGLCGGTEQTTCPATCPEMLNEGDACSNIRGLRCNPNAGLRCSGGTCIKPGAKDAACVDNLGCASGLLCVDDKCVPLAREGSGCSADSSCTLGLYCESEVCVKRKTEGQACSASPQEVDAALRLSQCDDGLICQGAGLDNEGNFLAGTCVKVSKEKESCKSAPQGVQIYLTGCQTGLICDSGKCAIPPTSGPCAEGTTCRTDQAYCSSDNVCITLLPDGADCQIPPECASNNCPDGKCVPAVTYCHE